MRGCALRKVVRKERESFIHRFPVPPLPPLGERERERERERVFLKTETEHLCLRQPTKATLSRKRNRSRAVYL